MEKFPEDFFHGQLPGEQGVGQHDWAVVIGERVADVVGKVRETGQRQFTRVGRERRGRLRRERPHAVEQERSLVQRQRRGGLRGQRPQAPERQPGVGLAAVALRIVAVR